MKSMMSICYAITLSKVMSIIGLMTEEEKADKTEMYNRFDTGCEISLSPGLYSSSVFQCYKRSDEYSSPVAAFDCATSFNAVRIRHCVNDGFAKV